MKNKLINWVIILLIVSLSFFIFSQVYQGTLPKIVEEINNSAIGAILTALVTVLLLQGQSRAEEIKERNVKVFEEKSKRFNIFINKLWDVWDDRTVSLEELNELIKIVSKDIVLYTKPGTVDKILSHLIAIADQAKPEKSNSKDTEVTKLIQQNIFDIINELAKEIGLGGELEPEIRSKLNQLEEKVVPFLIQKDFKKLYEESFKKAMMEDEDLEITNIEYRQKYYWCQIKESNVYLRIGLLEREKTQKVHFSFYVEFYRNRNFQKYRDAGKGWRKDLLRGANWWFNGTEFINFSDYEQIQKEYHTLASDNYENALAKKAKELYKNWKFDGKNIEEIIDECTT